jgi:hypothetical protein
MTPQLPSLPVTAPSMDREHLARIAVRIAMDSERQRARWSRVAAVGVAAFAAAVPVAFALVKMPLAVLPLFVAMGATLGVSAGFTTVVAASLWGEVGTRAHFYRVAGRIGLSMADAERALQEARQRLSVQEREAAREAQRNIPKMLFERRRND